MIRPTRVLMALVLAGAAGLFGFCVYHASSKPFTLDETDIALRAHLILRDGPFPQGFVTGDAEALTHPPLYDFTVAALFSRFGESERPVRLFGVFCYLIVGFLSSLTLLRLVRPEEGGRWAVSFLWIILLINPLLIQHALLVDADTTGTAVCAALLLFGWVFTDRWSARSYVLSRLPLALVTAAMFLFKEGAPVLMFAGLTAYRLLNREFKKWFFDLILSFALGALVAWGIWSVYAHALGMDPARIYWSQNGARYSPVSRLAFLGRVFRALPTIIRWPVFWNSAPLIFCAGLALALRVRSYLKIRKFELVDLLWLTGLAVWLPFLLFKPSIDMMKYQYPVYPALWTATLASAAAQVRTLRPEWQKLSARARSAWLVLVAALTLVLFAHYFRLGDYILHLFHRGMRPVWVEFMKGYFVPLVILSLVALPITVSKKRTLAVFLAGSLVVSLPVQAALDLRQIGTYTTAESWMNYGEQGLAPAVEYLSTRIREGNVTCLRKDLRYYLEMRHGKVLAKNLDPRELFGTPESRLGDLDAFLARVPIDFVVTDPVSLLRLPEDRVKSVVRVLGKYFEFDRAEGSFKIYRRKSAG